MYSKKVDVKRSPTNPLEDTRAPLMPRKSRRKLSPPRPKIQISRSSIDDEALWTQKTPFPTTQDS